METVKPTSVRESMDGMTCLWSLSDYYTSAVTRYCIVSGMTVTLSSNPSKPVWRSPNKLMRTDVRTDSQFSRILLTVRQCVLMFNHRRDSAWSTTFYLTTPYYLATSLDQRKPSYSCVLFYKFYILLLCFCVVF